MNPLPLLLFFLTLVSSQYYYNYQPYYYPQSYYGPQSYQPRQNLFQQWIEQRRRDRARDIGPKDGCCVGGPGGWGGGSGAGGGAWTGGH
ncbi:hypothetical protein QR680_005760 [Steinernema hermaphroditum]|uniref:Uncharacterized protein n=1 Tax=Steinernema hermaphroditum TaxID=289476 RepID=A0AA39LW00_9BILA|nr:hypothetical protein QR680_005760 [Steinernema hermaphroditum]